MYRTVTPKTDALPSMGQVVSYVGVEATHGAESPCLLRSSTSRSRAPVHWVRCSSNDYIPNATGGQPGYQTMKWTTVVDVSVTATNTTTIALPWCSSFRSP